MAHYFYHSDAQGDLIDITVFCSDPCHSEWCETNGLKYEGWNGCHTPPHDYECANCGMGVVVPSN